MTDKSKTPAQKPENKATKPLSKRMTKTLQVMEALGREEGVSLDELTKMTGWQPHSARGFLSNMRKKLKTTGEDSQIVKHTRDGKNMYKLEALEKPEDKDDA